MTKDRTLPKAIAALGLSLLLAVSCNKNPKEADAPEQKQADSIQKENTDTSNDLKPTGPAPEWGKSIKDEMAVVIEKLGTLGGKPIETLTAQEARQQPTPTDAVKAVMADHNMQMPTPTCDTIGKDIPVTGGKTHIRIYTPKGGQAPYPVTVYYHGGGFVIANIEVYNGGAQGLCEQTKGIVVSVEYPKGPEKKFPAAHQTAFDAYKWVLANAASFKGDPKKVAVAGESAGGNLACNVSIMARDKKIQLPLYQVLVYPVANNDMNSESYKKYANAKPLNKAMMGWFVKNALPSEAMAADPRVSLVKANLAGLPPTLIIGAEIDPLASEGKLLSDKLKDAKVDTKYQMYDGVTHEFFGMAVVVPQAAEAQKLAADELKSAFGM
ncbi:alpha/beta hydrolase [Flavobacterium sp.]|uniref:alpha/beta hydrolase n=1 Tax=Flavobacterium sp. TaxID=239 RepID=UPI0011F68C13|nr:alpha/beta hydrolase [Flavobacterium sp.]RZJ70387.1 MAG: alpha/beta hydrolase [Flavobacterium sp.]